MPKKDGYHVLNQLFKLSKDYPVLVLSAYATIKTITEVRQTGCLGFADKSSEMKVISAGIKAILAGESFHSPQIKNLIKDHAKVLDMDEIK